MALAAIKKKQQEEISGNSVPSLLGFLLGGVSYKPNCM